MTLRPIEILNRYSKLYPHAWPQMEAFRNAKGDADFVNWAAWCWVPVSGAYAVVSGGGDNSIPLDRMVDVAAIHALAAWRLSQGIYRFDSDVFTAIVTTPLTREIPFETLLRLPEWAVYIETPGLAHPLFRDATVHGFWASLEEDTRSRGVELRLLFDAEAGLFSVPLHLLPGKPLADCIADFVEVGLVHALKENSIAGTVWDEIVARARDKETVEAIAPFVNLVLYLCADQPDIDGEPSRARPEKTKRGRRWFPADKPRIWQAGFRIAQWLRRAREARDIARGEGEGGQSGAAVVPHVRRAHWHGFWTGPRDKPDARTFSIRWLPQIPVGFSVEDFTELLPTVKKVRS